MSDTLELRLTLRAEDVGTSTRQAQALERLLLEKGPPAEIRRVRTDQTTMDGGATLAVILASPVLLALAQSLRAFLERYRSSEIIITDPKGTVVTKNVSAHNVSELIAVFQQMRDRA